MDNFWSQQLKTDGLQLACQACGGRLPMDSAHTIFRDHMPYCSPKCADKHPGPPPFERVAGNGSVSNG